MDRKPRLRGSARRRSDPYPLGEIGRAIAITVGKHIVHRLAVGHADISGDDFGGIFAEAVGGEHRSSTLGVADVVWNGCAWSVKTIKHDKPFKAKALRVISGRNSPDYSLGISDPRANIQDTGRAVLSIWNSRVNEALGEHEDLRVVVMVRNIAAREFVLFEDEAKRFTPGNYRWQVNERGNFEGYDIAANERCFTWQPHGAQFTIHRTVPASACKFRIRRNIPTIESERILQLAGYSDDWIDLQQ